MDSPERLHENCDVQCPVRLTAEIIDQKWTTLIVRDLLSGKKRYFQLQKSLEGISAKILSERLRYLERQGLITRTEFPTNPPTTEYELTPKGGKLEVVIQAMRTFGLFLQEQVSRKNMSTDQTAEAQKSS